MASWVPVRLKPDPKARGWKPKAGWYCFSTKTLQADVSQRFSTKIAARKACEKR